MDFMRIITDERCTGYSSAGHPERPARITGTLERLRAQKEIDIKWDAPTSVEDKAILRAHTEAHLARVTKGAEDFDGDTPTHPNIIEHARRSVGGALVAMRAGLKGEMAMSVLRPPGHHATQDRAMGFCYLSNIAIAVLEAIAMGTAKVTILTCTMEMGRKRFC
jgi:acetoin utilization deacetylase AcuC-like enzyme